jgi:hypothetical protein
LLAPAFLLTVTTIAFLLALAFLLSGLIAGMQSYTGAQDKNRSRARKLTTA